MGTRVIHIGESEDVPRRHGHLDPAGTTLMLSISGSVLVASMLFAALSPGPREGGSLLGGGAPEPEAPPTLVAPVPGAVPSMP